MKYIINNNNKIINSYLINVKNNKHLDTIINTNSLIYIYSNEIKNNVKSETNLTECYKLINDIPKRNISVIIKFNNILDMIMNNVYIYKQGY